MKMDDTGLDEIRETFSLKNYYNLDEHIFTIQKKYIEGRIKWFWKLPLIRLLTAKKITFMGTQADIKINGVENGEFTMDYNQKGMVVGKSEFWANLLLKRRK